MGRDRRGLNGSIVLTLCCIVLISLAVVKVRHDQTQELLQPERYVDGADPAARDDKRYGTLERPWKTLDHAIRELRPGQVLYIRGGTYTNAGITLTEEHSGREDAPIVVRSYPNEVVVIENGKPIRFFGANWWTIEGLHFEQFQHIEFGLHSSLGHERTAAAAHITIRSCVFRGGDESVLSINYGHDIAIENNHFQDIRPGEPFVEKGRENNAVVIRYIGTDIVIRNNRFEDIGSDGVHVGSQSYLPGADIGVVEISGNQFWVNRPYRGGLGNVGENGIDIKRSRGPILVSGNRIHGFRPTTPQQDASGANGDGLIIHGEAQNAIVEDNVFYDNTAHLNIAKGEGTGPRNIVIRNNILRDSVPGGNDARPIADSALQVRSAANIEVYHNTFYNSSRYLVSDDVSRCVFKNNIVVGGVAELQTDAHWEADYNAWSETAAPVPLPLRGEHDIWVTDPRLGPDLRPLVDSPVVGAGQDLGIERDLEGRLRGARPDLGALQHTPG